MPHPSLLLSWRDLLRRAPAVPGPCPPLTVSSQHMFLSPTLHLKHSVLPGMLSYIHETALRLASLRAEAALITCTFIDMRVSAFPTHTDCWRTPFLKKSKWEAASFYLSEGPPCCIWCVMWEPAGACWSALTRANLSNDIAWNQQTFLSITSSAEWMLFTISRFGFVLNDSSVLCLLPPS